MQDKNSIFKHLSDLANWVLSAIFVAMILLGLVIQKYEYYKEVLYQNTATPTVAAATLVPDVEIIEASWLTDSSTLEENWADFCKLPNSTLVTSARSSQESNGTFSYGVGVFDLNDPTRFIQVTPNHTGKQFVKPAFSPDCQTIAMETLLPGDTTMIYLVDVDGNNLRPAFSEEILPDGWHPFAPTWNNQGELVMSLSHCSDCVPEGGDDTSIATLTDADKLEIIDLPQLGYFNNISISGNGTLIFAAVAAEGLGTYKTDRDPQLAFPALYGNRGDTPVWLPNSSDTFLYWSIRAIVLHRPDMQINLTPDVAFCKDPDVKALDDEMYLIIATCDNEAGISDFRVLKVKIRS